MKQLFVALGLGALLVMPTTVLGIEFGQVDDFQDGTVMGWEEGAPSPNPPIVVADGGPSGAGDAFLRNYCTGSGGPGGRMVMFNFAQWTGDYVTEGVDTITAWMRAGASGAPLNMRVTIQGAGGNRWSSAEAVVVPADDNWYPVTFDLTEAGMVSILGTASLEDVLSSVNELRILSSTAPEYIGEVIDARLDVDDITALPEPGAIALLAMGGAAMLRRRNR